MGTAEKGAPVDRQKLQQGADKEPELDAQGGIEANKGTTHAQAMGVVDSATDQPEPQKPSSPSEITEFAAKDPERFLHHYPNIKETPSAEEALQVAIEVLLSEENYEIIFKYYPNFKDVPGAKETIEKKSVQMLIKNPQYILMNYENIKDMTQLIEEAIRISVTKPFLYYNFLYFNKIKDVPGLKEAMLKAIETKLKAVETILEDPEKEIILAIETMLEAPKIILETSRDIIMLIVNQEKILKQIPKGQEIYERALEIYKQMLKARTEKPE